MSRKKYILSGKPKMNRANESGCVQVPSTGGFAQKPSDSNLEFRFVKQLDMSKVKPSRITPEERKRILAQENADMRR
tara:strand:+ start:150 stop:380 length:231 start_codon:yes stop_codon:yes gene_type:complete